MVDAMEPLARLQRALPELTPELRRAAQWVEQHPVEVGLWSMRRQAQALSLAPATMLRLARAAGYDSYDSFRAPFQQALHNGAGSMASRARGLQGGRENPRQTLALRHQQESALESVLRLNPVPALDAAAQCLLESRKVGFLGMGSSFGCAFQMHYAYQLMRGSGVLLNRSADVILELEGALGRQSALVVISQAPYVRAAVQSMRQALERGVTVVALTDSALSPIAQGARHVLLFEAVPGERQPASFFHSMVGPVALAEHLLARIAAMGGDAVVQRLTRMESMLQAQQIYWREAGSA